MPLTKAKRLAKALNAIESVLRVSTLSGSEKIRYAGKVCESDTSTVVVLLDGSRRFFFDDLKETGARDERLIHFVKPNAHDPNIKFTVENPTTIFFTGGFVISDALKIISGELVSGDKYLPLRPRR